MKNVKISQRGNHNNDHKNKSLIYWSRNNKKNSLLSSKLLMADSILDDLLAINSVCRVSTTPQSRDERTTGADDDRESHENSISERSHSFMKHELPCSCCWCTQKKYIYALNYRTLSLWWAELHQLSQLSRATKSFLPSCLITSLQL